MMNQPPNNEFYNSSTDNTSSPFQQISGQAPGTQWPQAAPNNYPPQGPMGGQPAPNWQQGPMSQPGFGAQDITQGPASQPGLGQQSAKAGWPGSNVQDADQQRQPGFPPPSEPISQPGFSSPGNSGEKDPYVTATVPPWEQEPPTVPPWGSPQQQPDLTSWEQQPTAPSWGSPQQQAGPTPWNQQQNATPWNQPGQQQPAPSAWGQQPGNMPGNLPNQTATQPKKSRLVLIISLVVIALVIIAGSVSSAIFLRTRGGNAAATTPIAQSPSSTSGVTPIATTPTSSTPTANSGLNRVGVPVQAGPNWVVTVTDVKETSSSLFAPNSGNIYLEVNLTLKNTSAKSILLVSYLFFTLSDGKHETASDTNIRQPADGNVDANQTLNAQIAFEVPKSQRSFTFNFAYGLSSNTNASVSWQFNV